MPMGGSGSKAEAVGVCGVAGAADAIVEAEGGMPIGGSGSKLEQSGSVVLPAGPHPQLCHGGCRGADASGAEELHTSLAVMRPIHRG